MSPIRVVIADADRPRHAECERLIREARHLELVAQAARWRDVLRVVSRHRPHVLVLGLDLPTRPDSGSLAALHARCPETKVVLLPVSPGQEDRVLRALAIGARAYLARETLQRQLCRAVRGINEGEFWVPRKMLGRILDRLVN